jgi:polyisoprenoid-binding protein YceI
MSTNSGTAHSQAAHHLPGYVSGRWVIDPVHSDISFVVRHLMVSRVRGRFVRFSGEIVTGADPSTSTVAAEIEMASIDTGNPERDDDLRSPTYLDVARYPTMAYHSTAVRVVGDRFTVDGDLTLHGVTRPVQLAGNLHGIRPNGKGGTVAGLGATADIDRRDFGINLTIPIPGGGVVVGDKIAIGLEIDANLAD